MTQPFPDDVDEFDPERRPPWPTEEELAIADDEETLDVDEEED